MPHASPTARRDMLAQAEERDSLLVRLADSQRQARNTWTTTVLVAASIACDLHSPSASGSSPVQEAPPAENTSPTSSAREVDWLMTFLVFVFPAVGGLLFGYDIGATSGALVSITSERTSGTDW